MLKLAEIFKGCRKYVSNSAWISWLFYLIGLTFLCWLAFLWHLGDTGLVDETEPLFAEASRQMGETGNWITPYFNGETRFDKPPLVYWLMAIGYQFIGINEWAVRLPSALSAIALTFFCFFSLRRFNVAPGQRPFWIAAGIGAALISLNLQTIIWARTGVSDMLLSGCMGSALLCFFWGYASQETEKYEGIEKNFPNLWYIAFYIFLALAVLAKGPVGVVLPNLIIVPFLIYVGRFWQVIEEMKVLRGGIIFALLTLPWYILIIWQNGSDYIESFFGYHNFERFTDVVNGHSAPWYFYFIVVLVGFLPWSVYLPWAINRLQWWRISYWRNQTRSQHLGLFALFWFLGIFVFFTVAVTKLPSYTLPLLPAAGIMVALLWGELLTTKPSKGRKVTEYSLLISGIFNFLLLVILGIFFIYSPNFIGNDRAAPNLNQLVVESGLPWLGGIIWLTTAVIIALFLSARKYRRGILVVNLLGFIAFLIFVFTPASFLVDSARQLPLRQLADTITQVKQPGEEVFMIGFQKPSLVFYTQNPVQFFNWKGKAVNYTQESLQKPFPSSSVLILLRPKYIRELQLQPDEYKILDNQGAYMLIRVKRKVLVTK